MTAEKLARSRDETAPETTRAVMKPLKDRPSAARSTELCRGGGNLLGDRQAVHAVHSDKERGLKVAVRGGRRISFRSCTVRLDGNKSSCILINTQFITCDYMTGSDVSWLSVTIKLRNYFILIVQTPLKIFIY